MDLWLAATPENLDNEALTRRAAARRHRLAEQSGERPGARAGLAHTLVRLAIWLDRHAGESVQRPAISAPAIKQVG